MSDRSHDDTVVSVVGAQVRFGAARAVDGVDLEVHDGEVLALVGESGSGKTTLIRAIQGLQPLADGSVVVGDARHVGNVTARDVQMVFQDPFASLDPRLGPRFGE